LTIDNRRKGGNAVPWVCFVGASRLVGVPSLVDEVDVVDGVDKFKDNIFFCVYAKNFTRQSKYFF
jgi:hypothetical protein